MIYSTGVALPGSPQGNPPYAAYPPDMAVHQLGQQVSQAMNQQAAAVGAQTQQTYEQMAQLYQQQQAQTAAQKEMNDQLLYELREQRANQQMLLDQLSAQRARADAHEHGIREAATYAVKQEAALEEMKRRTSAR